MWPQWTIQSYKYLNAPTRYTIRRVSTSFFKSLSILSARSVLPIPHQLLSNNTTPHLKLIA